MVCGSTATAYQRSEVKYSPDHLLVAAATYQLEAHCPADLHHHQIIGVNIGHNRAELFVPANPDQPLHQLFAQAAPVAAITNHDTKRGRIGRFNFAEPANRQNAGHLGQRLLPLDHQHHIAVIVNMADPCGRAGAMRRRRAIIWK